MMNLKLPVYGDVVAAAQRIAGYAHKTPVMASPSINEECGATFFFKCENFQRTGAFTFRGAINALCQFSAHQKALGVVTFSSGNHAQAIALSAKLLGIPATIVIPHDAPATKVAAIRKQGGHVVEYHRYTEDREQIGLALAQAHGLTLIPPYDHPHVIAGQGTAVQELFDDVGSLDVLFVGLGGGGLLSGSALTTRALAPGCKIYGVKPLAGNNGQQSFRSGKMVHIETPKTITDGAHVQHLGHYTFPIIKQKVDDILTVTDEELIDAMRFMAEHMKIVVEPIGCLGFAAAQARKHELRGKRVGIILSGGNVDFSCFAQRLA